MGTNYFVNRLAIKMGLAMVSSPHFFFHPPLAHASDFSQQSFKKRR